LVVAIGFITLMAGETTACLKIGKLIYEWICLSGIPCIRIPALLISVISCLIKIISCWANGAGNGFWSKSFKSCGLLLFCYTLKFYPLFSISIITKYLFHQLKLSGDGDLWLGSMASSFLWCSPYPIIHCVQQDWKLKYL
jgi:hypothetical protein